MNKLTEYIFLSASTSSFGHSPESTIFRDKNAEPEQTKTRARRVERVSATLTHVTRDERAEILQGKEKRSVGHASLDAGPGLGGLQETRGRNKR